METKEWYNDIRKSIEDIKKAKRWVFTLLFIMSLMCFLEFGLLFYVVYLVKSYGDIIYWIALVINMYCTVKVLECCVDSFQKFFKYNYNTNKALIVLEEELKKENHEKS